MKLIRFLLFLFLTWTSAWGIGATPAFAATPVFATTSVTVNKSSTYLTDTVLYTINLDNTTGSADALDVVFTDHLPAGIDVQAFSLDGVPQALTLLNDGLYVGTIPAGTSRTITVLGVVDAIPQRPDPAQYSNQASWTYRYRPTAGAPKVNASFTTNTVTTPVMRLEQSMSIATVSLPPILNLGTQITYTLTVQNTGTINSSGTTLTDAIPVGALYRAGTTKLNGNTLADIGVAGPYVLGGLINSPGRPAGQINAGETATITFAVTSLTLPVVDLSIVDADGLGPIPPLNLLGSTQANSTTDLAITNTNGTSSVPAGSNTTYTITVKNNGPTSVTSLRVVDNLPLTLSNPTWTASSGTYNSTTGNWTGLNLASGASVTLNLTARVSPLAIGTVSTTATVSTPAGVTDSNSANNSATDTDTVTLLADLGVAVADGTTSIAQGATISYLVTVTNNGPGTVSTLTLTDTISPALQNSTFIPDEGVYNSTTGAWTGLNLAPGGTAQITVTGTVPLSATGNLVNTLTVAPPPGVTDLNGTNNTASDTDSITVSSPLVLVQTVDKTLAKAGEVITYTITYRNSSALSLPGVGIQNATPDYTTFVAATYGALPSSLSGCTITQPPVGDTGSIKWIFSGVLAPGDSGTVSFQVLVK
ncbi:hypothetical protein IAD21_02839 [Abditibacteriota bacterium]|nr:hypothetical protein IAD21_02839 [Abditibacteriota bacterium]